MSRPRLSSFCLTAALTAATATALTTATHTAAAASESTCDSATNIFTVQADGDLWLYPHQAPGTGEFKWGDPQHIGSGWGGRTLAGPNGIMYSITDTGELRRLLFKDGKWAVYSNGLNYEVIAQGWQEYAGAANRTKITVDGDGVIYTLKGDLLHRWYYDEAKKGWSADSGRALAKGMSGFDAIVASGSGGLQARDAAGVLHRFRYHHGTERFVVYDVVPQTPWRGYDKISSAGGDVYYAVGPQGNLLWNRYSEDEPGRWVSSTGSVVGLGWSEDVDVIATTTDCSITGLRMPPTKPMVMDEAAPTRVIETTGGFLHLLNINGENELVDTHSIPSGWNVTGASRGHGTASPAVKIDKAGAASAFATTSVDNGNVQLWTMANGRLEGRSLYGAMDGKLAVTVRSDGTLAVYATGDHGPEKSAAGHLYVREQLPNKDFAAWRPIGDPCTSYAATPSVITVGDKTTIIVDSMSWRNEWFVHELNGSPVHMGTLPGAGTTPTLVEDGKNGILAFAVRDNPETKGRALQVLHENADHTGFETDWKQVGEAPVPDGYHVAAQLLPNGLVAVSTTANSKVQVTTSKQAGAAEFHAWQQVDTGDAELKAMTSLFVTRSNELLLALADSTNKHLLFTAKAAETPLKFTARPVS